MNTFLKTLFIAAVLGIISFPASAQNSNLQLRSVIEFPGQYVASVGGWTSPDGHEYALIGASKGLIITDITNPDVPVQIVQISGENFITREIKTYLHYAYITNSNDGIQVVDLSALPNPNLPFHNYTGNNNIPQVLGYVHTLHIDTSKGFLYTYGGDLPGAGVHDLNIDPYNPIYAGTFNDLGYIHDGYAYNDTLYACQSGLGVLSIVDMADKTNPVILGTVETPAKLPHNSWLLDDHKHILTTDEAAPSFLTSYDITDPTDIIELDRFSIDNGEGSIGHNVAVINDYAVTGWYTGGIVITDCHRPQNLIQVGRYDTYLGTGTQFAGSWNAFPYFPSGTVLTSNWQEGQFFIFTPTYRRACYLEGVVKNGCDGSFLKGAYLQILEGAPGSSEVTSNSGKIKTGQVTPGEFTVQISKPFYVTKTFVVNFVPGEVVEFDITLDPVSDYSVTGQVLNELNQPVANMPVTLFNNNQTHHVITNANGEFNAACVFPGDYFVVSGEWGLIYSGEISVSSDMNIDILLERKYYDDFSSDFGWTQTSTALTGIWTRGEPFGTYDVNTQLSNAENDVQTDVGDQCFMTGNGGLYSGADDVDGGNVILTSPAMALSQYSDAVLTFRYWFYNKGGNSFPNDSFEVHVSNGISEVTVFSTKLSASIWNDAPAIHLSNFIALNDNIKISFHTADDSLGHIVEAAVDVFSVTDELVNTSETPEDIVFKVSPNPSSSNFQFQYSWPGVENAVLEVYNALGQVMLSRFFNSEDGHSEFGENWPAGIYSAHITNGHQKSGIIKMIKCN